MKVLLFGVSCFRHVTNEKQYRVCIVQHFTLFHHHHCISFWKILHYVRLCSYILGNCFILDSISVLSIANVFIFWEIKPTNLVRKYHWKIQTIRVKTVMSAPLLWTYKQLYQHVISCFFWTKYTFSSALRLKGNGAEDN